MRIESYLVNELREILAGKVLGNPPPLRGSGWVPNTNQLVQGASWLAIGNIFEKASCITALCCNTATLRINFVSMTDSSPGEAHAKPGEPPELGLGDVKTEVLTSEGEEEVPDVLVCSDCCLGYSPEESLSHKDGICKKDFPLKHATKCREEDITRVLPCAPRAGLNLQIVSLR